MQPPNLLAIHPLRYASHSLLDFKVIGADWQVLRIHLSLTHWHYYPLSLKLQVKKDRDAEQAALSTQLNGLLVHLGSFGNIFWHTSSEDDRISVHTYFRHKSRRQVGDSILQLSKEMVFKIREEFSQVRSMHSSDVVFIHGIP